MCYFYQALSLIKNRRKKFINFDKSKIYFYFAGTKLKDKVIDWLCSVAFSVNYDRSILYKLKIFTKKREWIELS